MAVEAFANLRSRIRLTLQDSDGSRWDDDELDSYIQEAQLEYARRTDILKDETVITARENQEIYNFPEAALSITRIEDSNGDALERTTSSWLRNAFGSRFLLTTGPPTHIYSDLDAEDKFRFYPRPSPSIEAASSLFSPGVPATIDIDQNITMMALSGDTIYAADDDPSGTVNLFEFDKEFSLSRESSTAVITGSTLKAMRVRESIDGLAKFRIYYADTSEKFYSYDGIDTVTNIGSYTGSGSIRYIFPFEHFQGLAMVWSADDGLFRSTVGVGGDGYTETNISADVPRQAIIIPKDVIGDTTYWYYVDGSGGTLTRMTSLFTVQLVETADYYGIVILDDGKIYANRNGTLVQVVHAGAVGDVTIVPTSITNLNVNLFGNVESMFTDGLTIWAEDDARNLVEIKDELIVGTFDLTRETSTDFSEEEAVASDGVASFVHGVDILTTELNLGALISADNGTFSSEAGICIDSTDTEDAVIFKSDDGAVNMIFDADSQYRVWYSRKPGLEDLEVLNEEVLLYYALHRAYEKEIAGQDFNKSGYFLEKALAYLDKDRKRSFDDEINSRAPIRTYYI